MMNDALALAAIPIRGRNVAIVKYAKGGAIDVVILTAAQRPQKAGQRRKAEEQCQGNKKDQDIHLATAGFSATRFVSCFRRVAGLTRKALSVTTSEEPDIARAAIRGVTIPNIASGTAEIL